MLEIMQTTNRGGLKGWVKFDLPELISDMSGWVYSASRGWYNNDNKGYADPVSNSYIPTPPQELDLLPTPGRIKAMRCVIYGVVESSLGAIGYSILQMTSSGVISSNKLGTADGWANSASGMRYERGDLGTTRVYSGSVNKQQQTCTVLDGRLVRSIGIQSCQFYSSPQFRRGLSEFEFFYK